jgi:predicted CXXCH cytochrome family protein
MTRHFLYVPVVAAIIFAAQSHAAQTGGTGPETIKLTMGKKAIEFTHRKHQKVAKCWECHAKTPGKIDNWGEATAHKLCIPCHDLNAKGPVACKGCHKK